MHLAVFCKIRLCQLKKRVAGLQTVLLKVHESAGELDQSFVKVPGRSLSQWQPQIFEDVVSFVEEAAVEIVEIRKVVGIVGLPQEWRYHFSDFFAFDH